LVHPPTYQKDLLPESIQDVVAHIAKSGLAKKVILFGSRARGDSRDNSDFDLAVEWCEPKSIEVMNLLSELDEKPFTLHKIDLLSYNDATSSYVDEIKNEGIILWEKKD